MTEEDQPVIDLGNLVYKCLRDNKASLYMTLHANMALPNSHWYLSNVYLINNAEDMVVFLGLKVFDIHILLHVFLL